jgi:multisubunit Na+/H+ antiporter MnhF subunit
MGLLDIIIVLLVLSWLGGFAIHVGGGLIHLLIVIALVMFIFRIVDGRRV